MSEEVRNLFPQDMKYTDALPIANYIEQLKQEKQQLKEKVEMYENPEDLTLMFMYCTEEAKDKIKLLKENLKTTNKGLRKVILKRKKWKDRYYNERYKNKKLKNTLIAAKKYIESSLVNVGRNEDCFEYHLEDDDIEQILAIIDEAIGEKDERRSI